MTFIDEDELLRIHLSIQGEGSAPSAVCTPEGTYKRRDDGVYEFTPSGQTEDRDPHWGLRAVRRFLAQDAARQFLAQYDL